VLPQPEPEEDQAMTVLEVKKEGAKRGRKKKEESKEAEVVQKPETVKEPVPAPKRAISTVWTKEEVQILYDLIATGESSKPDLIMELLPGKTLTNIKRKITECKKLYENELFL